MNGVTAGPAAPAAPAAPAGPASSAAVARPRAASPTPVITASDFAVVLAGLAEHPPASSVPAQERDSAAPPDRPVRDSAGAVPVDGSVVLDAAALLGPRPDRASEPAAATEERAAPPVSPPVGPGSGGAAGAQHIAVCAGSSEDLPQRAPGSTVTGSARGVAPAAPVVVGAASDQRASVDATQAAPARDATPEALVVSVPPGSAGAAPTLDARSTTSPAGAATALQSAGPGPAEAMLPADAATVVEAPQPDVAPAAPAAASTVAVAEVDVAAQPPADLRGATAAGSAPVPAPAPTAPAPPAAAPPAAAPPAAQVAQLLAPVLAGPDGSYSMSLQLHPEGLGAVQVEVLLRGSEIRLAMHAPDEAAQAALRSALPDLRAELQAGGLSATSLSVDDGRPGQSSPERDADRSPDRRPDGSGDHAGRRSSAYGTPDPARPLASHADAALDLRM